MITQAFNLLRRFLQIDLVKVFSLTSISTLVRMLTGIISIKIVAIILGWIFLNEVLSAKEIIGTIFILGSSVLIYRK